MHTLARLTAILLLILMLASCNTTDNIHWKKYQPANIIRINFGRAEPYKDHAGNVWMGDQGIEGGDIVDRGPDMAIKYTSDPDIFRTEHWGMDSFSYPLPNGKYLVKMYFAETSDNVSGPGGRVFDITVQGQEFKDFDVWANAGGFATPYVESVPVTITDGKLEITFVVSKEQTEINGIEIIPQE